jgi:hypothetical protein
MSHNTKSPLIILVATATDRKVEARNLRELPAERTAISDALQLAEDRGLCQVIILPDATLDKIYDAFEKYRNRIAIFHFAGHADSDQLHLELGTAGPGLAETLGNQQNLGLVFLNSCST